MGKPTCTIVLSFAFRRVCSTVCWTRTRTGRKDRSSTSKHRTIHSLCRAVSHSELCVISVITWRSKQSETRAFALASTICHRRRRHTRARWRWLRLCRRPSCVVWHCHYIYPTTWGVAPGTGQQINTRPATRAARPALSVALLFRTGRRHTDQLAERACTHCAIIASPQHRLKEHLRQMQNMRRSNSTSDCRLNWRNLYTSHARPTHFCSTMNQNRTADFFIVSPNTDRFSNFFHWHSVLNRKFAVGLKQSLKIQPHLKHAATIGCKIYMKVSECWSAM